MLKNGDYNKVKILNELSALAWFVQQHSMKDATNNNDTECHQACNALKVDLEKHITVFKELIKECL